MLKNVHPGEILLEEFLKEFGISQNRVGREIGMSPRAINEIVHEKRSITANSALRLAKYFGTSPEFWLNLQTSHDLEEAAKEVDLGNVRAFDAAEGPGQSSECALSRALG
jgi:addiction module HigA family antidote